MYNFEPTNSTLLDGSNSPYSGITAEESDAIVKAGATLTSAAIQARKNSPKGQAKQENKAVCGRKPLLAKNRGSWNKCVADHAKQKTDVLAPDHTAPKKSGTTSIDHYANPKKDDKILGMNKGLAISLGVALVVGGGFLVYWKFFRTPGAAAPVVAPV